MQNEELRRAQVELDAARARYFDLYDLAPVGYCTVSEEGLILEANLTAASLLGVARGALVGQRLTGFILPEDEDIYYLHRKQLFETGEPQACELRMVKKDGTAFWAHLEATAAEDPGGEPVCRVVMSDNPDASGRRRRCGKANCNTVPWRTPARALIWTSKADKKCDYFNQPWLDFTGRTLAEELGDGWVEDVHPEDLQRCIEVYTGAFERRERFSAGLPPAPSRWRVPLGSGRRHAALRHPWEFSGIHRPLPGHHRAQAEPRWRGRNSKRSFTRPRRWNPSGAWRAAWLTISTTC